MNKMKGTGIPWLPEIAEDFSLGYVKQYFYVSKDLSDEGEPERVLKLARAGIVEKDVATNEGQMAASYAGYNKVQVGDLLLNPMDLYSGANCNVSELNGVISPAYSNLRAKKAGSVVPKFYDYYFKSQYWLMAMFAHGKGVSFDNRWTLNNDSLRAYEIPVVPYVVQQHIVERIQSEERKVDTLIANVQAQIEKLKAYKQSLITEVVTKGLDPTVPMKDSGVAWLGLIPKSWSLVQLKNAAVLKTGHTPPTADVNNFGGVINWYTPGDFVTDVIPSSTRTLTEYALENEGISLFPQKTTLLIGIGGTAGKVCKIAAPGYSNQQITAIIAKEGVNPDFLFYEMMAARQYLKDNAMYTTLPIINNGYLGSMRFVIPSAKEQEQIVGILDEKCSQINRLISIKQAKIEKLEQYKKSLIYEYVTGKKQVEVAL